jgi:hypothetical protein
MAEPLDRATIKIDGDSSGVVKAAEDAKAAIRSVDAEAKARADHLNTITSGAASLPDRAKASDLLGTSPNNIASDVANIGNAAEKSIPKVANLGASLKGMGRAASAALGLGGAAEIAGNAIKGLANPITAAAAAIGLVVFGFEKWRAKIEATRKELSDLLLTSQRFVTDTKGVSERNIAEKKSLEDLADALDTLDERYAKLYEEANKPFLGRKDKESAEAQKRAVAAVSEERAKEEIRLQGKIAYAISENDRTTRSRNAIANKEAREKEEAEAREAAKKSREEERQANEDLSNEALAAENANRLAKLTGLAAIKEQELQTIAEINKRRFLSNQAGADDYQKRLIEAAHNAAKIQAEIFAKEMQKAMTAVLRDVRNDAAAAFPTDQIATQIGAMHETLQAIEARMQAGFQ